MVSFSYHGTTLPVGIFGKAQSLSLFGKQNVFNTSLYILRRSFSVISFSNSWRFLLVACVSVRSSLDVPLLSASVASLPVPFPPVEHKDIGKHGRFSMMLCIGRQGLVSSAIEVYLLTSTLVKVRLKFNDLYK